MNNIQAANVDDQTSRPPMSEKEKEFLTLLARMYADQIIKGAKSKRTAEETNNSQPGAGVK